MNPTNRSMYTIFALLFFAAVFGIMALFFGSVEEPNRSESFSRPSKSVSGTLHEQEGEAVLPGWRRVEVSDGSTVLAFEVPQQWMVESRHAGNKNLTVEEMREFLGTSFVGNVKENPSLASAYSDYRWSDLLAMSDQEIQQLYNRKDGTVPFFPTVSVSSSAYIQYSDTNFNQIDFIIIPNFSKQSSYYHTVYQTQSSSCAGKCEAVRSTIEEWREEEVGRIEGKVAVFAVRTDEDGNESVDKALPGGAVYFVPIPDTPDMLVIFKQAKGNDQDESNFRYLLSTVSIRR